MWYSAGAESAVLEVRAGNKAAISLYHKLGFAEVGKRKAYYSDGEDALLMQKDLKHEEIL
jgi:ribosomal-protein-alanine N-acetyltransferase